MMKLIIYAFFIICSLITGSFAQSNKWTNDEIQFYQKLKFITEYFHTRPYDTAQRGFVFKEFVYFENILTDTSNNRIKERIRWFDGLFIQMLHFVDSVGLENLDAAPTRFFKDDKIFFRPFDDNGELNELLPLTLVYFDKRKPNHPIGSLLFEKKTHKLLSWIIINQGGYCYFLTFNLI